MLSHQQQEIAFWLWDWKGYSSKHFSQDISSNHRQNKSQLESHFLSLNKNKQGKHHLWWINLLPWNIKGLEVSLEGMWHKEINNLEEDTLFIKTVLQVWITVQKQIEISWCHHAVNNDQQISKVCWFSPKVLSYWIYLGFVSASETRLM